jgi:hypothetical protein
MINYRDAGFDLFKEEPELMVAAVWQRAAKLTEDRDQQREFVNAYIDARRQRDEYRRDQ